jgi:microcystin-dependent protein
MAEPFMGQIISVGFNFAPLNWALCNGQLMSISQNDALFTLLGTTYGGDGQSTFGLPNLQGRVPINQGQGPGLNSYALGQMAGTETVTLLPNQLPQHNHFVNTANSAGSTNTPASNTVLSDEGPGSPVVMTYVPFANAQPLTGQTIGQSGSSLPHDNQQPYLVVNFCIALYGLYPSQN